MKKAQTDYSAFGLSRATVGQYKMLAFLGDPKKSILLWTGGLGCGKSWGVAAAICLMAAVNPGCMGLVCGRSLNLHKRGMLRLVLKICGTFKEVTGVALLKKKIIGQQIVLTFFNECEVHFLGEDNFTLDRTVSAAFAVIDEASRLSDPAAVIDEAIGRVRDPLATLRKVIVSTNSDFGYSGFVKDHLEKIDRGDPDRTYITSPTSENMEGLDEGYIRRNTGHLSRKRAEAMTLDILDRSPDVIYPEYQPSRHIKQWNPVEMGFDHWDGTSRSALPWCCGFDPTNSVGFVIGQSFLLTSEGRILHPTYGLRQLKPKEAAQECVIMIDQDVGEYGHTEREVQVAVELINKWEKIFRCKPSFIATDRANKEFRQLLAKALKYNVNIRWSKSREQQSVEPGLDRVRQWLDPKDDPRWPIDSEGAHRPPPRLYFAAHLHEISEEQEPRGILHGMLHYRYKSDSNGNIRRDWGPDKDGREDVMDGLRYLVQYLCGDAAWRSDD